MLPVSLSALSWLGKFSELLVSDKFQTANTPFNTTSALAQPSLWLFTSLDSQKLVPNGWKITHFQDSWSDTLGFPCFSSVSYRLCASTDKSPPRTGYGRVYWPAQKRRQTSWWSKIQGLRCFRRNEGKNGRRKFWSWIGITVSGSIIVSWKDSDCYA